MKKFLFYIWFMALVCIVIDTHKALANEADYDLLYNIRAENKKLSFEALTFNKVEVKRKERTFFGRLFAGDTDNETEFKSISISIREFNAFMTSEMRTVQAVYNTRKSRPDRITFSVIAIDGNPYHNIECKVTLEVPYETSPDKYRVLFSNCGSEEVRFRDTVDISYEHLIAGELNFNN